MQDASSAVTAHHSQSSLPVVFMYFHPCELDILDCSAGKEMDLPEGGKLKKLVVPPATPLRALGSGLQPDSSAALHEAMAHGDMVTPCSLDLTNVFCLYLECMVHPVQTFCAVSTFGSVWIQKQYMECHDHVCGLSWLTHGTLCVVHHKSIIL